MLQSAGDHYCNIHITQYGGDTGDIKKFENALISTVTFKIIIPVADIPKEDMITQLPDTNAFLQQAIGNQGTVLVHW